MTTETIAGEADRLLDGTKLARPNGNLWAGADGVDNRDPGPEWDWFYQLDPAERRWIFRDHMAERGTHPADAADWAGAASVDDWAESWLSVARASRRERSRAVADRIRDPATRAYADDWQAWDADQESAGELYGPQELAYALGISANLVHQWRRRGKLPAADVTISGVPIWSAETLKASGTL